MRLPLEEIFRRQGKKAIDVAYRAHGYRMMEVADYLEGTIAMVSRALYMKSC